METRTNEEWLRELGGSGVEQAEAIKELRGVLMRASMYTLRRTQYRVADWDAEELAQLAEDSAQEALLAILERLGDFRGESRFTTWAFKFAVNKALLRARRESWRRISLDGLLAAREMPELPLPAEQSETDPDRAAWRAEVWETLRDVINNELTPRQRAILIAMTFDDVPLDQVVEYFNSNRNAIYKNLHDARRKLKAQLEARGLAIQEVIQLFARG